MNWNSSILINNKTKTWKHEIHTNLETETSDGWGWMVGRWHGLGENDANWSYRTSTMKQQINWTMMIRITAKGMDGGWRLEHGGWVGRSLNIKELQTHGHQRHHAAKQKHATDLGRAQTEMGIPSGVSHKCTKIILIPIGIIDTDSYGFIFTYFFCLYR